MQKIIITLKDGTEKIFEHQGRPGGSYTKSIRYEGEFAIVSDEYDQETVIPACNIQEIKTFPNRW